LGRSYGDQAVCEGGTTLDNRFENRLIAWEGNTVVAQSGLSLQELLALAHPRGYTVPVCPGTQYVTLGGCLANNVHGKGHHRDGSFIDSVLWFDLHTAGGETLRCSKEVNSDLYWANAGGAGLLGYIGQMALRLAPIKQPLLRTTTYAAPHLEALMGLLDTKGMEHHYSVGWINTAKKGYPGVLTCGEWATANPGSLPISPSMPVKFSSISVPFAPPFNVINPVSLAVLNGFISRSMKQKSGIQQPGKFFFPLDGILHWNRAYGPHGLLQFQCVLPMHRGVEHTQLLLKAITLSGCLPFLNVIKRFGPSTGRFLSFPMEGYTIALDFPVNRSSIALCKHLSTLARKLGGRVYLAKDAVMTPDQLAPMYPELDAWKGIKRQMDPSGKFASAMSRRLKID
jgi:FAD/FMN-containing dehydrogenase